MNIEPLAEILMIGSCLLYTVRCDCYNAIYGGAKPYYILSARASINFLPKVNIQNVMKYPG